MISKNNTILILMWIFLSTLNLSFSVSAQVYPIFENKKWDEQLEKDFSIWIETQVDEKWLEQKDNPFYLMKVDCADFIYLSRLYFSWKNQVEFAIIHNGKKLSTRGDFLNQLKNPILRLRKFAEILIQSTSTETLHRDTVLVPLTKPFIKPGLILLSHINRKHSMIISKIKPSGIPEILYGDEPARAEIYRSYYYPAQESFFLKVSFLDAINGGGLRRFKWPEDLVKPMIEITYASGEQLKIPLAKFFDYVQEVSRAQVRNIDMQLNNQLDDLCMKMRMRTNIVTDAIQRLKYSKLSQSEIDLYSTPNRDKEILANWKKLSQFYDLNASSLNQESRKKFHSVQTPEQSKDHYCFVDWAQNRVEPLGFILKRFESKQVSSEPTDTIARRWGL